MRTATAEIHERWRLADAAQKVLYFLVGRNGGVAVADTTLKPLVSAHDDAVHAISALAGLMLQKGLLQRVKALRWLGEPVERHYVIAAVQRAHRGDARAPDGAVDENGACAALSDAASESRSALFQLIAQDIQQW